MAESINTHIKLAKNVDFGIVIPIEPSELTSVREKSKTTERIPMVKKPTNLLNKKWFTEASSFGLFLKKDFLIISDFDKNQKEPKQSNEAIMGTNWFKSSVLNCRLTSK